MMNPVKRLKPERLIRFERLREEPVIPRTPGTFYSVHVANPDLLFFREKYYLYFRGQAEDGHDQIGVGYAEPEHFDGIRWRMENKNPIIEVGPGKDDYDSGHILDPATLVLNGHVYLYYSAHHRDWKRRNVPSHIGLAVSEDGTRFNKSAHNPILTGTAPEALIHEGRILLFVQRRTADGYFEIWCCPSEDGIHFPEEAQRKVFSPSMEDGAFDRFSISTVRIFQEGDWYYIFYGGCPQFHDYPAAIGLARSRNLVDWERYPCNPVFERGEPGAWDEGAVWFATVHRSGPTCLLWYEGAGAGLGLDSKEAKEVSRRCREEDYGGYGRTSFSQIGLAAFQGDSLAW
jgi:predicted GH43/DUF377 family glycosyl hydrolase